MYLDAIKLDRFRSCADTRIKFQSDLIVPVGENNGGKTNIIDAFRLLTLPLNGRRDRYPDDDDIRKGSTETDFRIEGRFADLSDTLKGLLIGADPDPTTDIAVLGMRYQAKVAGYHRGRTSFWAGRFDTAEPEPNNSVASFVRRL